MCEGKNQGLLYKNPYEGSRIKFDKIAYALRKDSDEMLREKYGYDPDKMFRFSLGDYMELNLVNGAVIKGQLTMMVNDIEPLIEINDKKEYALKQIKGNPFIYQSLENFLVIEKQRHVDK